MFISYHLSRYPRPQKDRTVEVPFDIFTLKAENKLYDELAEIDPDIYHSVSDATLYKEAIYFGSIPLG